MRTWTLSGTIRGGSGPSREANHRPRVDLRSMVLRVHTASRRADPDEVVRDRPAGRTETTAGHDATMRVQLAHHRSGGKMVGRAARVLRSGTTIAREAHDPTGGMARRDRAGRDATMRVPAAHHRSGGKTAGRAARVLRSGTTIARAVRDPTGEMVRRDKVGHDATMRARAARNSSGGKMAGRAARVLRSGTTIARAVRDPTGGTLRRDRAGHDATMRVPAVRNSSGGRTAGRVARVLRSGTTIAREAHDPTGEMVRRDKVGHDATMRARAVRNSSGGRMAGRAARVLRSGATIARGVHDPTGGMARSDRVGRDATMPAQAAHHRSGGKTAGRAARVLRSGTTIARGVHDPTGGMARSDRVGRDATMPAQAAHHRSGGKTAGRAARVLRSGTTIARAVHDPTGEMVRRDRVGRDATMPARAVRNSSGATKPVDNDQSAIEGGSVGHDGEHESHQFTVAIDGPAAVGKSTVGEQVAARLGAVYFDTGILYRALTLEAIQRGIDPADEPALARLAADLNVSIQRPSLDDGRQSDILLNGQDVTWELRSGEVDRAVSLVSALPAVRQALLEPQRRIGRSGRVVMVGRDIGTVVLPGAEVKIFLVASVEERARRRFEQFRGTSKGQDLDQILADLCHRDAIDSARDVAPLRPADDSIVIDTDPLTTEEVIARIVDVATVRLETGKRP
ncbi:MAG: (d)CMP kinase [Thermomicrobiales bacterium]